MTLQTFKTEFDPLFFATLQERINALKVPGTQPALLTALEQLQVLARDGKRIRPYLTALAHTSPDTDWRHIVNKLCTIELVHLFALIHDDVMDQADQRHGQATLQTQYRAETNASTDSFVPESQAILLGDLVFTWAMALWYRPDKTHMRAATDYAIEMLESVILGQALDVSFFNRLHTPNQELDERNEHKTASYTFTSPLLIGLALRGEESSDEETRTVRAFGSHLGAAFQTQDDYLDVHPDSPKALFTDVQAGVPTRLTNHVRTNGTEEQIAVLQSAFGEPVGDADKQVLIALFSNTGAYQESLEAFTQSYQQALQLVPELPVSDGARAGLNDLVELLIARTQ
jgi:geranylgeranyl diphosphate synthase type I